MQPNEKPSLELFPFDTHQMFKKLTSAGFTDEQAEVIIELNLTLARSLVAKFERDFKLRLRARLD